MYAETKKIINIYKKGIMMYEDDTHYIFKYNKGETAEYFMFNEEGHISQFLSKEAMEATMHLLATKPTPITIDSPDYFKLFLSVPQEIFNFFLNFFEIFITSIIQGILDSQKKSNFF
jgi:hypothetical protein